MTPPPFEPSQESRPQGLLDRLKAKGGILATIAFVAWKALSLLKLAFLGKYLLTIGSAFVSIWFYTRVYGAFFAVGLVLMLFVHECGHALAARRYKLPYSGMMFVPFMGAVVMHGRGQTNAVQDAFIGIMGPVVGGLYGIVCIGLAFLTGNPLFLALASSTFFINLFNLLPTAPLDGGWIAPLFSPKLLAFGAILLVFIGFMNPFIWLLALLSLPRIIAGWKAGPNHEYFQATAKDRWKYGFAYVGLALSLGFLEIVTRILHGS
jgi:Zn-dependent protease